MGDSGDSTESTSARAAGETIAERRFRSRLVSQLQFADFMGVMMVVATAFSALATWRTATIANAIYLAAERAYFGVESIQLNAREPNDPRVEIDYRNFGNVTATHMKMLHRMTIDGAQVTSATKVTHPGILSPGVSHLLYLHVPAAAYAQVVAGKSELTVQIAVAYTNPRMQPLCYMNTFTYASAERYFVHSGGTLDCADQHGIWPEGQ
jgi:hypothetical protein